MRRCAGVDFKEKRYVFWLEARHTKIMKGVVSYSQSSDIVGANFWLVHKYKIT